VLLVGLVTYHGPNTPLQQAYSAGYVDSNERFSKSLRICRYVCVHLLSHMHWRSFAVRRFVIISLQATGKVFRSMRSAKEMGILAL